MLRRYLLSPTEWNRLIEFPLEHSAGFKPYLDWIEDQWDRTSHFYTWLAGDHATASTALKRLAGFTVPLRLKN